MSRTRLPIVMHQPPEQIDRSYRACRTGVEETHWQLLRLLTRPEQPLAPAQAAAQVGLTAVWARTLLERWNAEGPTGLADRRLAANAGQSKLSTDRQIDLGAALPQSPPDGGLWTGPKVAAFVRDRWGVRVCKQAGWEWPQPGLLAPGAAALPSQGRHRSRAAGLGKRPRRGGSPSCAGGIPRSRSSSGPRIRPGRGSSR